MLCHHLTVTLCGFETKQSERPLGWVREHKDSAATGRSEV